ncbi:MAG: ribulokinase [Verrucomicrobiota bacterium]|nr:ribulokinase [Verrucomicrobiota bacterium]
MITPDKFVIGVDFGTLSGRAVIVNVDTGEEVGTAVYEYPDGVITETLPGDRKKLQPDTALQNPRDYVDVLKITIPKVMRKAKISAEQVIGIGTDFTACTMLPVRKDGTPLSYDKKYAKNPHAWVKLWKHHSAQPEANTINNLGEKHGEEFIRTYGGKYSSEWFFSKLLETVNDAPEIYDAADRFIEAADWIVWQLTGVETRNLCTAGYKAMWVYPYGEGWAYPSPHFLRTLHPKLENVVNEKLSTALSPLGTLAGGVTPEMAVLTGLNPGTPVCVGNVDAHAAVPACTVTEEGKLVMIMGTSTCHMLLGKYKQEVEGMCGVVKDGIIGGYWGYEAGQSGVGDIFNWYVDNQVPHSVYKEAKKKGLSVHDVLTRAAAKMQPGESGILALDWFNGNRSVLVDADLTGLVVGANLSTKPHEIYRALIEATAFGTRKIIEAFTNKGVQIDEIYACGGLPERNKFLMQIYADVTERPIKLAASKQTCALGAAMHAAVAAGYYETIQDAARKMARVRKEVFTPNKEASAIYRQLYDEYTQLHDLFGRGKISTMKALKELKRQQSE